MKLKLHKKLPDLNVIKNQINGDYYENSARYNINQGLVIVEIEPCFRTIICQTHNSYNNLALPYILFVISYSQEENGRFLYTGFNNADLKVFFKKSPLLSMNDDVWISLFDFFRKGIVCTPHGYDYSYYPDLFSLVKSVIGLWFNCTHYVWSYENFNSWKEIKDLKQICETNFFGNTNTLYYSLINCTSTSSFRGYSLYPFQTEKIIDLELTKENLEYVTV